MTTDQAFLWWVADRLVQVHGESPYADFVRKLRAIAEALPADQETPVALHVLT